MKKYQTAAILIGINNNPGGVVVADVMGDMIRHKRNKLGKHIPIVTYAEEKCTNAGMHLLMQGDVVLANPLAWIGSIGFRMTPWMVKHLVNDTLMTDFKFVHQGENKVRLNRMEPHKQQDIDWALNMMNKMKDRVAKSTLEARANQIGRLDADTQAEARQIITEGHSCYGYEAEKLGLIDEATTPEEYFEHRFKGSKIEIQKQRVSPFAKFGGISAALQGVQTESSSFGGLDVESYMEKMLGNELKELT
jgi:ClpP class serine protease